MSDMPEPTDPTPRPLNLPLDLLFNFLLPRRVLWNFFRILEERRGDSQEAAIDHGTFDLSGPDTTRGRIEKLARDIGVDPEELTKSDGMPDESVMSN